MTMEPGTAVAEPVTTVLEIIQPFQADDGHKGTFLILRIAGLGQGLALRLINRKYRTWQNWHSTDEDFRRIDDEVPVLIPRFGGEARVIRTALLDISIVEAGIGIFRRILNKQAITDGMWSYAVKMAGLRVPMMGAQQETGSPWEKLANAIQHTLAQRELTYMEEPSGMRTITAKEIVIEPSPEQKRMASEIVQQILAKERES